jgi:hypothetical protein
MVLAFVEGVPQFRIRWWFCVVQGSEHSFHHYRRFQQEDRHQQAGPEQHQGRGREGQLDGRQPEDEGQELDRLPGPQGQGLFPKCLF